MAPATAAAAPHRHDAYVIDARLALSAGGLLLCLQLARENDVWLTRRFWKMVDDAYYYHGLPQGALATELEAPDAEAADGMIDGLMLWNTAWMNGALNGVFHWIGDARRESALPDRTPPGILGHFERLLAELDGDLMESFAPAEPIRRCGQEAVALAASLAAEMPTILTVAGADATPPLCQDMEAERIAPLRRAPQPCEAAGPRALKRAIASGARICAVDVHAPFALLGLDSDQAADGGDAAAARRGLWHGSRMIWWTMS
jgi:hypothetical protein